MRSGAILGICFAVVPLAACAPPRGGSDDDLGESLAEKVGGDSAACPLVDEVREGAISDCVVYFSDGGANGEGFERRYRLTFLDDAGHWKAERMPGAGPWYGYGPWYGNGP
jgi:hypothetical protein